MSRNHGLQAARAFACLVVLVGHSIYRMAIVSGVNSAPMLKVDLGTIGVALFFVLSGMIMGSMLVRARNPFDFMLHRLLRIYPALRVAAGISALLLIMRGGPLEFDPVAFFLLPGPKPSFTWGIPLWTLIYEMVFYVVIFALMLCRMPPSASASVLTGWAFATTAFFFYGPHVHHVYPGSYIVLMPLNLLFIAGAMTALYPSHWFTLLLRPILVLLAFSLWAASLGVAQENLRAVSCVCALSAFAHAAFRWPKVIVRIGDASYGKYLLHFACIEMVATFIPMLWPGVPFSVGLPAAILIALTASGLFGLAEFSAYSMASNFLRRLGWVFAVAPVLTEPWQWPQHRRADAQAIWTHSPAPALHQRARG